MQHPFPKQGIIKASTERLSKVRPGEHVLIYLSVVIGVLLSQGKWFKMSGNSWKSQGIWKWDMGGHPGLASYLAIEQLFNWRIAKTGVLPSVVLFKKITYHMWRKIIFQFVSSYFHIFISFLQVQFGIYGFWRLNN